MRNFRKETPIADIWRYNDRVYSFPSIMRMQDEYANDQTEVSEGEKKRGKRAKLVHKEQISNCNEILRCHAAGNCNNNIKVSVMHEN